ncbi:amidohydrolase [Gordonia sp. HY285]|uniref:Amidohydrolase n=1 Tax=Gordonia liuliyuniae TaxID=2911517 RepID=A0ABS9IWW6_9ACTN|nr:amidohydrolase family protein [Gordonia liuliyuniae]MCF8590046.1 amidohydrolase [Gordonia liuliyuniae]MCF8610330.1 amidohydrolase [Gordonia liuliyuniae]
MTRIDVHQHLLPPLYRRVLDERGLTSGGWPTPAWDPRGAIAAMDHREITTGVLSVSAPGVHFGDDDDARQLARAVNDYQAELMKDRPERFGHFAVLTLPDVKGAIVEATYALEELKADGVVLLSNAQGTYLGDPSIEPLWEYLDTQAAVVFIHPAEPPITRLPGLPSPVVDYPFDTTRTAVHMVANGVMARHRRMRVILAHAGGFLPYAAERFTLAASFNTGATPEGIRRDLRSFYFDTALSSSALPALLAFAAAGHVLYGSDFPFAPAPVRAEVDAELETYRGWQPGQLAALEHHNAEALFPRLRR